MKYIKLFNTTAAYNAVTLDLPNVSLIEENMGVTYNPWVETRVVTKYNVTSTSSPTVLRTSYENNIFKSMEIDGVMLDELVTEYTFDTIGEHTVKYELYDETKLGNNAPVFNTSLTSIFIPNSVTSIGASAFIGCNGLISCTIGSGVTSIGGSAFNGCISLTSITIPSGVTSINYSTFQWCSSLTSITIPSGVISIGNSAFSYCSSLTSIICNATTAPTISSNTFQNVKTDGTLTVPQGSSGYDVWMGTGDYYLGKYNWTKVEQ